VKANSNRKYTFPIDRAPNGIPFGVMETEKCSYNPNLLSLTRSRNIFFGVNYYYYTAAVMKKKDLTVKKLQQKGFSTVRIHLPRTSNEYTFVLEKIYAFLYIKITFAGLINV